MPVCHSGAQAHWPAAAAGEPAERALRLAGTVIARIEVRAERAAATVPRGDERRPFDWAGGRRASSLADGFGGLALLNLYAARAGIQELSAASRYVREAVAATRLHPFTGSGLFAGTSGLAMVIADCAQDEPRFRPMLERLHTRLAEQVLGSLPPRDPGRVRTRHFDLAGGAAGTLCHLSSMEEPDDTSRTAAQALADYLIWLSTPPAAPDAPPRWLVTPDRCPPGASLAARYPHGHLDCGLAHGAPGVAVALAAAWQAGHRRPGHLQALRGLTSWLRAAADDGEGPVWPAALPAHRDAGPRAFRSDRAGPREPGVIGETPPGPAVPDQERPGWCYGSAGVSAALRTAADALDDDALRQFAVSGFEAALRRTRLRRVTTPVLCHGLAGLLMICLDFAAVSEAARGAVPHLVTELLARADPERPFLFADRSPSSDPDDGPGLLTGAAGVVLALLAATGDRRPRWFHAFLGR
ncbi:lanthionine synthetase LanC family protein [Streptomyces spiralis]|uniref:lanthionine synthetase LanC family protein n=1 Tax=Streptomyces spiralis TaxID=66376 RepID=UPI0036CCD44F